MELLFGIPIGVIIGILTSLCWRWTKQQVFSSKVIFSKHISKIQDKYSNKFLYRIKYGNFGRGTNVDIDVSVIIAICGLDKNLPHNYTIFDLDLISSKKLTYIRPRSKDGVCGFVTPDLEGIKRKKRVILPKYIQDKLETNTITLEDLLSLGNRANLLVTIVGFDETSGNKRIFISKRYTLEDILVGRFKIGSFEINSKKRIEN